LDTDAVLKAGHVVESERDMQFCAKLTDSEEVSSASSNVLLIAAVLSILSLVLAVVLRFLSLPGAVDVISGDTELDCSTSWQHPRKEPDRHEIEVMVSGI
jgi:hypothetical protein